MARAATTTTDHEAIRSWAESHGGHPAAVKGTGKGDDPGMLRIDFPGFSGERSLEEISWRKFFRWFELNELALLYREGDRFNKFVSRKTARARSRGERPDRRRRDADKPPARRAAETRRRVEERRRKARATSEREKPAPRRSAKRPAKKRATRSKQAKSKAAA